MLQVPILQVACGVRLSDTHTNDSVRLCRAVLLMLTASPHSIIIEQTVSKLLHLFSLLHAGKKKKSAFDSFCFTVVYFQSQKLLDIPKNYNMRGSVAESPTVLG